MCSPSKSNRIDSFTSVQACVLFSGFHDDTCIKAILMECAKMIEFKHPNVLALIGVCLDGGLAPYIIMPFMSNGSLLSYLRKFRKNLLLPLDNNNQEEVIHIWMSPSPLKFPILVI